MGTQFAHSSCRLTLLRRHRAVPVERTMAIIQALLTMLFRQMGRVLNTAFGWATTLLFGQVPEKRQTYLSAIALGSGLWLVVVLGIAFPRLGAFLLAFVPLPEWASGWVRLVM